MVHVRVNVPQEGPRASASSFAGVVSRPASWRSNFGGHRLLSFQVEHVILRGTDEEGDAVSAFALEVYAAIDHTS